MNSIHNPTIRVKLRDGEAEVSELSWPDALILYNRLMVQSKGLLDDAGRLALSPDRVITAIQENVQLGQWLVLKSTGKDQAWLEARTLSEALDLASEAAVLNIGIIVERLKNARSRLSRVCGMAGQNETPSTKPCESTGKSPT